jgi:hypothetical protein
MPAASRIRVAKYIENRIRSCRPTTRHPEELNRVSENHLQSSFLLKTAFEQCTANTCKPQQARMTKMENYNIVG